MKKKTRFTKTLALVLTLGLLCSGLAGCGQARNSGSTAESLATESTQTESTVADVTAESTAASAEETSQNTDDTVVRVASLKGPTSLGLLFLMDKANKGETANTYEFRMATGADEILPLMVKGDLDIALIPANVASILYHKTQGGVEVIDINTLGVLYMVSGEDGLADFTDLKGKTIYLTGKGTTPDYVLQYLLNANGMSVDDVTLEYKSEATEVASVLAEDPTAIGLLPQPFVTAACMQNDALKVIFDLNEEWNKVQGASGSSMVTGVTVVRKEFLEENEEAVKDFMEEHKASAEAINADPATGAALAVEAQIVAKEPIAQKAIPDCNITYMDKADMKQALSGYLDVLFHQDSQSIGGGLPESDFYYDAE
ncbi:MAG: ABC transporter substrate-binding protein [Acetatifactor sp.]|nr:ABC transporter substrate-binding protein [Acetatifactor sp.]